MVTIKFLHNLVLSFTIIGAALAANCESEIIGRLFTANQIVPDVVRQAPTSIVRVRNILAILPLINVLLIYAFVPLRSFGILAV